MRPITGPSHPAGFAFVTAAHCDTEFPRPRHHLPNPRLAEVSLNPDGIAEPCTSDALCLVHLSPVFLKATGKKKPQTPEAQQ